MADIQTGCIEQDLTYDGYDIINVSLSYPIVSNIPKKAAQRINAFYLHNANALLKTVKKHIFPAVCTEYMQSLERSVLIKPYEIILAFKVTYNGEDIISLYRDIIVTGGRHRQTERYGDTWSVITGWPVPLDTFFPRKTKPHRTLIKHALEIAEHQESVENRRYYDNYKRGLKKHFSYDNYYITDGGVACFYNEETIAPRSEGIQTYILRTELAGINTSAHPG